MVGLPLLGERKEELARCTYCPKLCRAACPVSEATSSETLTPWGKMMGSFRAERGEAMEPTESLAYACTGCLACREVCDHQNPVFPTLLDARADAERAGRSPREVEAFWKQRPLSEQKSSETVASLNARFRPASTAPHLLIGCGYTRRFPEIAADMVRVASRLLGEPPIVLDGCCGAVASSAGRPAADSPVPDGTWVVDPGCLSHCKEQGQSARLLLDLVHDQRMLLRTVAATPARYHDPCKLGRGLRRFVQPREVLEVVLGRPPLEFEWNREQARCSGAGGLLPISMPDVATAIGSERLREHTSLGGGTIVTACSESLQMFRRQGAIVEDIMTLVARAL